ncbi:MAG: hypothetical protein IKI77_02110 [Oscillospiraceae bacterium]|nr:hypothetical protein [Oscillospiraceae bacterium]
MHGMLHEAAENCADRESPAVVPNGSAGGASRIFLPDFGLGVVETGSHKKEESASRILFRMEKAAPFGKGGFLQASFFPKLNAGEFRDLRIATRALPSTCQLLKKLDQNFNTGARRIRNNKSLNSHSLSAFLHCTFREYMV